MCHFSVDDFVFLQGNPPASDVQKRFDRRVRFLSVASSRLDNGHCCRSEAQANVEKVAGVGRSGLSAGGAEGGQDASLFRKSHTRYRYDCSRRWTYRRAGN